MTWQQAARNAVMDDDASALAPEWLDEPAWWGGRACDALPRPPSPPAAPLTPAPESPEAQVAAARADAHRFAEAVILLREENAALKQQLERALVAREDATAQQRVLERRAESAQADAAAAAAEAAHARGTVSRQEAALSRLALLLTETRAAARAAAEQAHDSRLHAAPSCNGNL